MDNMRKIRLIREILNTIKPQKDNEKQPLNNVSMHLSVITIIMADNDKVHGMDYLYGSMTKEEKKLTLNEILGG